MLRTTLRSIGVIYFSNDLVPSAGTFFPLRRASIQVAVTTGARDCARMLTRGVNRSLARTGARPTPCAKATDVASSLVRHFADAAETAAIDRAQAALNLVSEPHPGPERAVYGLG